MPIHTIDYNRYRFVIYTEDRVIRILYGGYSQKEDILEKLPEGFNWEGIELIFQKENRKKEVSELAIKIFELYQSKKLQTI